MNTSPSVIRLFVVFGLLLVFQQMGWTQVTRFVSTTGISDPVTATTWATSTNNLQWAIDVSSAGDVIFVAAGTYKPTSTANRTVSFSMKNGVAIYGGFRGNETALNQRPRIDPVNGLPSSTTLSGDIGSPGDPTDNSYHVISNRGNTPTGLTTTALLDGFVITGGNAVSTNTTNPNDESNNNGGGVYNAAFGGVCSPSFRSCLFQGNFALFGGGMANDGYGQGTTQPQLTNCVFQDNTAFTSGGAMFNNGNFGASSPVLTNCSFRANTALSAAASSASGGAIYNLGASGRSSPVLTNCAFQANKADYGGAIYDDGRGGESVPQLTNCSFQGNTATQQGGAIYNLGGLFGTIRPGLANSVFWNNGGANTFYNNEASITTAYCLFEPTVTGYDAGTGNLNNVTTSPFASTSSVALATGSPAINAGNPASQTVASGPYSATALPPTDLAGNPRIVQGRVDMGAVEYRVSFSLLLLTAVSPSPVCAGSTTTLSVTASQGTAPYSYTWSAPAGISLSATSTPVVSASVGAGLSGVQTLTITVADGTTPTPVVSTSLVSLTVSARPTATLAAGPSSTLTCAQTSLTLTANASGTGLSYAFVGPGGTLAGNGSTRVVSGPGTYTVTVTASNDCAATATTTVTSNTVAPNVRINPASQTICQGQTASFMAQGADTYQWSSGNGQPGQMTATISVSVAGPYSVTGTATSNGCSSTATVNLTVNPLPTPTLVGLATAYCQDAGPQSLSGSPSGGVFTVDGNPATTINPASLSIDQHTVVYSYTNTNGCSNTATQAVTVKEVPTPPTVATVSGQPYPAAVSSLTISQNVGSIVLTVSGCAGGTISWGGGSATTMAVSTANLGLSTYPATCTRNGCTSPAASFSLTVVPTTLSVLHRDADYGQLTNNILKPYLQLANAGGQAIPYSEVTVRYWFTSEGNAPPTNLAVYYAQLGTVNMNYVVLSQPRQGAYGYVEYSFPGGGSLGGGGNSGPIENGIQKTDGSNFDESDDYSYQANYQDYVSNAHVTAYRNGVIFWGQEPTIVQSQTAVQVYTQAQDGTTTSQIQTRVELRNTGNVALAIQDLRIRYYFTSDNNQPANVYVDYADIGASNIQARVIKLPAPVGGADSYVELRTVPTSQSLAASSSLGAIDFRLVRSDNGLFDQSNDYSFMANYGSVGLNNRVTVLLNNRLIFGMAPTGAPARVIAVEAGTLLTARLLGNPVVGSNAQVEITGVTGQAVQLRLVDLQGRAIHEQRIEQAGETERVNLPMGSSRGTLLLKVSTDTQQQRLKLLRP